MEWYITVLKKYAEFSGRARRKEFWMFILINVIISAVLSLLGADFLGGLYSLAVLIPSLAVGARRLHDTGRSGWWQLIYLVPLVGLIVMIVFTAQEGAAGDNKYGSNPKLEGAAVI